MSLKRLLLGRSDRRVDNHRNTEHIPGSPMGVLDLSPDMPVEHVQFIDQAGMDVRERGVVGSESVSRRAGHCARGRHVSVAALRRVPVRDSASRARDLCRHSGSLAAED